MPLPQQQAMCVQQVHPCSCCREVCHTSCRGRLAQRHVWSCKSSMAGLGQRIGMYFPLQTPAPQADAALHCPREFKQAVTEVVRAGCEHRGIMVTHTPAFTLGLQHRTETVLAAETISTRNCNHRRLTRSNRPSTEHVCRKVQEWVRPVSRAAVGSMQVLDTS